jgi:hypothetical protein
MGPLKLNDRAPTEVGGVDLIFWFPLGFLGYVKFSPVSPRPNLVGGGTILLSIGPALISRK